jgi:hypothetical protein
MSTSLRCVVATWRSCAGSLPTSTRCPATVHVLQALELDGRIFRCVAPELLQEVDVQLMAVANYYNHIPAGTDTTGEQYLGCYMDVAALARHIHQRLQLHDIFCHDFWGAIAATPPPRRPHRPLSQPPPPPCPLLMLVDCGVETSYAFKTLIAEYLGVPLGGDEELSLLRRARSHLPLSSSRICRDRVGVP